MAASQVTNAATGFAKRARTPPRSALTTTFVPLPGAARASRASARPRAGAAGGYPSCSTRRMSSSPRSVLIVDGESAFATAVARCLASAGARVHVLSRHSRVPARLSRSVTSFAAWSDRTPGGLPRAVAERSSQVGAAICLAVDQPAIRAYAVEADVPAGGPPMARVPPLRSFDTAADKWFLASFLHDRRLDHPATILCDGDFESNMDRRGVAYPVLVKPRHGSNGAGIVRVETPAALHAYLAAVPGAIGTTIIQTEIAGSDVDCSVYCRDGRIVAYTIQRPVTTGDAAFGPNGDVEFVRDDKVLTIVSRLMAHLRWSGVAHVDLRYRSTTGQPAVIEVNPRYWGSLIGSLRAGINFPWLAVAERLGLEMPAIDYSPCRYASGNAALRVWLKGHAASPLRPLPLADTAWVHLLRDPAPHVAELCGNWYRAHFDHRHRAGVERPAGTPPERDGAAAALALSAIGRGGEA